MPSRYHSSWPWFAWQIAWIVMLAAARGAEPSVSPLSPQEELKTFHLADPRLTIELVAAEPDVLSPVAICWDADGRMYVAEMTDYPSGPVSGRIRMLEDRDGDGYYERSTIFADHLPFPNGLMAWKEGVLVTAAPDLWFLADKDGDGVADVRQKILTGFAEGNQQLRANGLFWGIDNWIYGANGRSDGEVRWADSPASPTISIRRRDFRFRPDQRKFEPVAGNSQFGMGHDNWGNRFPVFNNIPIRQVVFEDRYLERAPYLAGTENVVPISAAGDLGQVYPLAPPMLLIPQPAGFFTSACGPSVYRGTLLPPDYDGNAFICEAVQNLIERRRLQGSGPAFLAARTESHDEFLVSADPWFHGVFTTTGPDGAFYVVDFYRKYVEHPHWVAKELQGTVPWRTGEAHGRIWRVRAKNSKPTAPPPRLSHAPGAQLVEFLKRENGWWRDTAQRLIVERGDASVTQALLDLIGSRSVRPESRLQALYTLQGVGGLSRDVVISELADPDSHLRIHALRLAENFCRGTTADPAMESAMLALAEDPDAAVRFQFALSAGEISPAKAMPALARLAQFDAADPWQATAILTSIGRDPALFLRLANFSVGGEQAAERFHFMVKIGQALASSQSAKTEEIANLLSRWPAVIQLALLNGFSKEPSKRAVLRNDGALKKISDRVEALAGEADEPDYIRVAAIELASQVDPRRMQGDAVRLLSAGEPQAVQSAAAHGIALGGSADTARKVFAGWTSYSRATRAQLAAAAARSPAMLSALADALEAKAVSPLEIEAATRQQLSRMGDAAMRARLAAVLELRNSNRQAVIDRFKAAATMAGDRRHGAEIFSKTCLTCHSIEESGGKVGPDLASVASRPRETLLVDILDPNRQVLPDYASYTIEVRGEEPVSGVISAETQTGVTLRRPNLPDLTVPRERIQSIRADGKSPMPEGLEEGLDDRAMADLLEFLQHPSKDLLQQP